MSEHTWFLITLAFIALAVWLDECDKEENS